MSEATSKRLYNLLPELYRWRDQQQGEPLQAFLSILERELHTLEVDMEAMYDNWFIQTCDNWVVPYLADLLEIRDEIVQIDYLPFTQRRRVANTLAYRRRKGTVAVLEQVLWDVTNWHVRAVEFHRLLATTQHLQHLHADQVSTVNLQDMAALAALESPFTALSRSGDIRTVGSPKGQDEPKQGQQAEHKRQVRTMGGKYNPHTIGLFFWRLRPYPVDRGFPKQDEERKPYFTFSPTGHDTQLFNRPQSYQALVERANAANMPILVTRAELAADLRTYRRRYDSLPPGQRPLNSSYYGPDRSFNITNTRDELLFDSNAEYQSDLDQGRLADGLREEFKNHGHPLSQNVSIRTTARGTQWLIDDLDRAKTYKVRVESNAASLDIYRDEEQILPAELISADLTGQPDVTVLRSHYGDGEHGNLVAVDPELGHIAILSSQKLLFGVDSVFANELDAGQLSAELRGEFKDHKRPLTVNAKVTVDPAGKKWAIDDTGPDFSRQYIVRYESQTLNVYPQIGPQDFRVDYTFGFSGDVGGGPYPRHFAVANSWESYCEILVAVGCQKSPVETVSKESRVLAASSLAYALLLWNRYCEVAEGKPRGLIRILDNGIYVMGAQPCDRGVETSVQLPEGAELAIVAEDGVQPTIESHNAPLAISFPQPVRTKALGEAAMWAAQVDVAAKEAPVVDRNLLLSGLRITGELRIEKAEAARINALDLVVEHCTILQGGITVALETENAPALNLAIRRSIVGPLRVPANVAGLHIAESIVDRQLAPYVAAGDEQSECAIVVSRANVGKDYRPGPPLTVDQCTIFGKVQVERAILANAVIFTSSVSVKPAPEEGTGLLRYCYVPAGSEIQACERCLHEDAETSHCRECLVDISRPVFSSRRYGRSDYAQLSRLCADEIRSGVGNIAEIGVFHHLYQPERQANIQIMLDEYLPLGIDAGVFHVT